MPTKRKPAQIVQCPYCTHKGSARGLFTHVRLAHPSKGYIKPPISEKVSIHPYACNGDIPSFESGGKLTIQENKLFKKIYEEVLVKISKTGDKTDANIRKIISKEILELRDQVTKQISRR